MNSLRKFFLLVAILLYTAGATWAQDNRTDTSVILTSTLPEFKVKAKWLNDTDRYHYNQTKFYVTTILPYLNAATKLFKEVNEKAEDGNISRKERRQYINAKEDEMRSQFEDKLRTLNVTQGGLLVKLIARQTELNIYKILLDFKNPLVAVKWQAWARVNGMNLDRKYHPEEEPMLENIMDELGYPLPAGYNTALVSGE